MNSPNDQTLKVHYVCNDDDDDKAKNANHAMMAQTLAIATNCCKFCYCPIDRLPLGMCP